LEPYPLFRGQNRIARTIADDAPPDPRNVRVSRLPFENFLVNGHYDNAKPYAAAYQPQ
jgi:hypothetical protein